MIAVLPEAFGLTIQKKGVVKQQGADGADDRLPLTDIMNCQLVEGGGVNKRFKIERVWCDAVMRTFDAESDVCGCSGLLLITGSCF